MAADFIEGVCRLPGIDVKGMFSTFMQHPDRDGAQLEAFLRVDEELKGRGVDLEYLSMASSDAVFHNPEGWLEGYVIDISKVKICHAPPGNPDNARTLSIGWDSIGEHVGHGDEVATCEFLKSGARSRSVEEFRPSRPANMDVPAEALDAKWHSDDAMKAQQALYSGTQSAPHDDTALDTPADRERSRHQRPARRPQR